MVRLRLLQAPSRNLAPKKLRNCARSKLGFELRGQKMMGNGVPGAESIITFLAWFDK